MQNNVGEQLRPHRYLSVVVDQPELSELVHEVSDSRARRTYHFCQRFMAQPGHLGIRDGQLLAKARHFEQNAGKALLAMIEELVTEILFQIDIASEQGSHELFGKVSLSMKSTKHGQLVDSKQCRGLQSRCRADSQRLPDEASFTEKIPGSEHCQYRFPPLDRHNSDFDLSRLNEIDGVGRTALSENRFTLSKGQQFLSLDDVFEQVRDVRIWAV